jgi:hypothetical protein
MSDTEGPAQPPPAAQPAAPVPGPHHGYGSLHLPEFWPDTPAAWFLHTESKFRLKNIATKWDKYGHLVGALPRASPPRLVPARGSGPGEAALKEKLLSTHELTNFERIEKLMQLKPLGARKPTELLAEMLQLCPRGRNQTCFSCSSFSSAFRGNCVCWCTKTTS